MADDLENLKRLLGGHYYRQYRELDLQEGVGTVLGGAGVEFVREHAFDRHNRVDYWLPAGGFALEIKTGGPLLPVVRQLARYAAFDAVKGVLLFTGAASHLRAPKEIEGKPVRVCLAARRAF